MENGDKEKEFRHDTFREILHLKDTDKRWFVFIIKVLDMRIVEWAMPLILMLSTMVRHERNLLGGMNKLGETMCLVVFYLAILYALNKIILKSCWAMNISDYDKDRAPSRRSVYIARTTKVSGWLLWLGCCLASIFLIRINDRNWEVWSRIWFVFTILFVPFFLYVLHGTTSILMSIWHTYFLLKFYLIMMPWGMLSLCVLMLLVLPESNFLSDESMDILHSLFLNYGPIFLSSMFIIHGSIFYWQYKKIDVVDE